MIDQTICKLLTTDHQPKPVKLSQVKFSKNNLVAFLFPYFRNNLDYNQLLILNSTLCYYLYLNVINTLIVNNQWQFNLRSLYGDLRIIIQRNLIIKSTIYPFSVNHSFSWLFKLLKKKGNPVKLTYPLLPLRSTSSCSFASSNICNWNN